MDSPPMTRNRIWIDSFSQVVTMPLLTAGGPTRSAIALLRLSGRPARGHIRQRTAQVASPDGLMRRDVVRVARQGAVELAAGGNAELGEDLAEVVLDRAGAEEQPGADLRVRQAVAGQPRDHRLLRGQLAAGLDRALAGGLAGSGQLAPGPLGKRLDAHLRQHVVGGAQLLAGVAAAALAAQPFAVEQVGAGQLHAQAGAAEAVNRLPVPAVGDLAAAQQ